MTVASSPARALRLPRDFALIALGLEVALFVLNMAVLLLPATPEAAQLREVYARPDVWVPLLAGVAMAWVLVTALSWSHARHALETQGVARVALAADARLRFGGVWVLVMVANRYALTPLFYEAQLQFMPGGRFADVFGDGARLSMGVLMLLQSLVQLAVVVLGLWLAARIALAKGRGAATEAEAEADAELPGDVAAASPRRAVAMLVAAVFVALQLWAGLAVARSFPMPGGGDVPMLLLAWVLPALVSFGLAFWGGWLGTRPGLALARPFRAVAAAVAAFVLVQVACIATALAWLFLAMASSFRFDGGAGLIGFVVALVLLYTALSVLLTRAAVRGLYRRYL
jgi:hypothetical protein